MKSVKKILAMCLAIMMIVSCIPAAHAADVPNTAIDLDAKGSLTLYKYDLTNAEKDGVWDSSYVSTGVYDENVNKTLGESKRAGDNDNSADLGNGEVSYGYAVKGVEFTYLRVGDIVQYTESANDGDADNHIEILYGIDKAVGADLLTVLGLENGADRYTNADHLDNAKYYYQSDVLIDALAQALQNNSTTVKNALETYVANNGGTAMPLTGAYGKSQANNLDLGLYIIAETKCPEMVTSTCAPFFLSIPMSPVSGSNATDGNTRWLYDVTIYPKNLTGIPTLTKSLRENVNDTGKHKGATNDVTDGYANTGTASDGDVIDYQILSTLASITSKSTYYSELAFIDTLSPGLSYNKNDIPIGGKNTNCIIAGHRGWGGASYFRYVDKLQPGDEVIITNLWETLQYRVAEIQIIQPNEVEQILIKPGQELVTLLTCHPYASGGRQRYLVICERVNENN